MFNSNREAISDFTEAKPARPALRVIDGGKQKEIPGFIDIKKSNLLYEEVKETTKDTGTSIPHKDKRYFENSYIDTSAEKREKRTQEVAQEATTSFETLLLETDLDENTKLSILQNLNGLKVNLLYDELNYVASTEPEAQEIRHKILDTFWFEKQELDNLSSKKEDEALLFFVKTRESELNVMEAELQRRWIEKEIWDLHVDWSKKKEDLQKELDKHKQENLRSVLSTAISNLREEREVLVRQGEPKWPSQWSDRLSYVTGRLASFENSLRQLDVEARVNN